MITVLKKIMLLASIFLIIPLMSVLAEDITTGIAIEEPVLITSVGQSVDAFLVKAVFDKLRINADLIPMANQEDLRDYKQVFIVPGFSHKGLSSAGFTFQEEINRTMQLVETAEEFSQPLVLVYIGSFFLGDSREENLLEIVASSASFMIIYEDSPGPLQFLLDISEEKSIQKFFLNDLTNLSEEFSKILFP